MRLAPERRRDSDPSGRTSALSTVAPTKLINQYALNGAPSFPSISVDGAASGTHAADLNTKLTCAGLLPSLLESFVLEMNGEAAVVLECN